MDNASHYRYMEAAIVGLGAVCKALVPSLGPCGRDALITTKTGQMLITNNGGTILASVEIEHPGVRLVLDAATNFLNATGDGSKMFFIFSTILLSDLFKKSEKQRFSQSITQLRRVMTKIRQSLFKENTIKRELNSISCQSWKSTNERNLPVIIKSNLNRLLHSVLHGRFSAATVTQFIQLMIKFMDLLSQRDVNITSIIRTYRKSSPVIKIPGASLGQSIVFSGHLLAQIPTRPRLMSSLGRGSLRAIIVRCIIQDCKESIFQSVKLVKDDESSEESKEHHLIRENLISKMVSFWAERNIKLVISTYTVDDIVSDFCERRGIAIIQCIEDDDADQIAVANNTHPINYEETLKSAELDRHIFSVSSVALISAGGAHYFQLNYHTSKTW